MLDPDVMALAHRAAHALKERGETIAVAEGSCGGLISAALLAVPGASAYYLGGMVIYTARAYVQLLRGVVRAPEGMRGATEPFARHLAEAVRSKLDATWGVGEGGAAGPANPYGDPAGHAWVAVSGPVDDAQHVLTGLDDREQNMVAFSKAALDRLVRSLT